MKAEMNEEHFYEPKSWCFCGHLGDGPMESFPGDPMWRGHHGGINGHGACMVEGCDCEQFTWKRFTNRFNEWYARREDK